MRDIEKMTEAFEIFRKNVEVISEVTRVLASSLGPAGKAKLFVLPGGKKLIISNGKTILKLLPLENPVARLAAEFANSLDDGIKSTFVLAGSLLLRTLKLAHSGMHPMNVLPVYQVCAGKATDFLLRNGERLRRTADSDLKSMAENLFLARGIAKYRKILAALVVDGCQSVSRQSRETDTGKYVDLSLLSIFSERTGHLGESKLIRRGAVVPRGISYPLMHRCVENAKIAMLVSDVEFAAVKALANVRPTSEKEIRLMKKKRAWFVDKLVGPILEAGANVVVSKFKMNHTVLQKMAREGILVVDQVEMRDLERLLHALGGRLVSILDTLTPGDLGRAELVREMGTPAQRCLVFTGCRNSASGVINLRCVSDYLLFEAKDALLNAAWQIKDIMESGMIVYGAGSIEAWLADYLREWAQNLLGIERMAAVEFAAALEEIPRQLVINSGFSPSRTLAMMHDRRREEGYPWWGVDIKSGGILDAKLSNIADPLDRTRRYMETAVNLVEMVVMLDEPLVIEGGFKNTPGGHMVTRPHYS